MAPTKFRLYSTNPSLFCFFPISVEREVGTPPYTERLVQQLTIQHFTDARVIRLPFSKAWPSRSTDNSCVIFGREISYCLP